MSCSMTALTILTGMAKPMPILPPSLDRIAELMPISSPFKFTSAPPELPVVEQCHRDLARILDDVAVGDDVAFLGVHDHARAGALELAPPHRSALGHVEESTKVRILAQRIAHHPLGQRAAGCDVDHRG